MNTKFTTFALSTALFAFVGNGVQAQMLPLGQAPTVNILQANALQSPKFSMTYWDNNSFSTTKNSYLIPELETEESSFSVSIAKGFASFREKGEYSFTFKQEGEGEPLKILGVIAKDLGGTVVAADIPHEEDGYHSQGNTFTLDISEAGLYELYYLVDNRNNEPITSHGVIEVSPAIYPGVATFDLPLNSAVRLAQCAGSSETKANKHVELGSSTHIQHWNEDLWKDVENNPQRVQELGFGAEKVKQIVLPVYLSQSGEITANYIYKGRGKLANKALHPIGVDLLDNSDKVIASDYHSGKTGHKVLNPEYKLAVDKGGNYRLRFLCETKTEAIASVGDIEVSAHLGNDIWHIAKNDFYNINVDKNATKERDRALQNIKFASPGELPVEIQYFPQDTVYFNYTDSYHYISTLPGAEVNLNVNWKGNWMHSYLYLDRNQNNKFDVTNIEDEELVYCTGYNNQRKTKKGVENESEHWYINFKDATFTAPTQAGLYRLRYKIDWNSIDPGGYTTTHKNHIIDNRGNIVDFVVQVLDTKLLSKEDLQGWTYKLKVFSCTNGNYATMMLPYPVRLPEGVYAYKLKEAPSTGMQDFELIESKDIPAYTPVFITAKAAGEYDCEAYPNHNDPIKTNLEGTNETLPASKRDPNFKYYVLVKDEQGKAVFRIIKEAPINANRCFLKIPVNSSATAIHFELPQVAGPTGVSNVAIDNNAEAGATYNLAGQRIETTSAKGVVVRNGKKVLLP